MKRIYIIFVVLLFLGIGSTVIYLFSSKVIEMTSGNASDYYIKDEYSGVVTKKFINTKQHNYRTVVIEQNGEEYTVLFCFEMGGLYEFIEVGDYLSTKEGTLDVHLKRKDLDTIVTMQIYERKKRHSNIE